jgi:branched-subunit amino acid aminotransferase/4-amino-4-deoxychorismate lyase
VPAGGRAGSYVSWLGRPDGEHHGLRGVHEETPVDLAGIAAMQGAFATNSAVGVRAIGAIGDTELPESAPVLDILRVVRERP